MKKTVDMKGQPVLPGLEAMRPQIEELEARKAYALKPERCASCETEMDYDTFHNNGCVGDAGTQYADQTLCGNCYSEGDAEATIRLMDQDNPDGESDSSDNLFEITDARNGTADNGDIGLWKTKYVRTDGWRGYFDVVPPKGWVRFHSDCSLSMSEDSDCLAKFDEALRKALIAKGARLVRAVTRTSNCFSSGVDYFVEKKHLRMAKAVADTLAKVFRDPVRFNMTALTGKDPAQAEASDYVVAAFGAALLSGHLGGK